MYAPTTAIKNFEHAEKRKLPRDDVFWLVETFSVGEARTETRVLTTASLYNSYGSLLYGIALHGNRTAISARSAIIQWIEKEFCGCSVTLSDVQIRIKPLQDKEQFDEQDDL